MYACMYVRTCVWVCMITCNYLQTYVYIYIYIYINTYINIYIYIYIYLDIWLQIVTPKGVLRLARCKTSATHEGYWASSSRHRPHRKINVTSKSPVGDISVVTLIRTDTTLDHSQKAEKVWIGWGGVRSHNTQMQHQCMWQGFYSMTSCALGAALNAMGSTKFCWEYPLSCCPVGAGWWSALELSMSCGACGWSSPTKQVVCKDPTV